MEKMSLTVALKRYCSVDGETTSQFMTELKKLTPEDKAWFKNQFEQEKICEIIS
jgi:hypothetical protein